MHFFGTLNCGIAPVECGDRFPSKTCEVLLQATSASKRSTRCSLCKVSREATWCGQSSSNRWLAGHRRTSTLALLTATTKVHRLEHLGVCHPTRGTPDIKCCSHIGADSAATGAPAARIASQRTARRSGSTLSSHTNLVPAESGRLQGPCCVRFLANCKRR
jgi:hypothetical protein